MRHALRKKFQQRLLLSPLGEGGKLISFTQQARLSIDEDGCEVAAFSAMAWARLGMKPSEKVDFVLDRPFAFLLMEGLRDGEDNRKDIPPPRSWESFAIPHLQSRHTSS